MTHNAILRVNLAFCSLVQFHIPNWQLAFQEGLQSEIVSCLVSSGSSLEAVTTCELCKEKLHLSLDNFDIHELHRAHANEQVSIFWLIW